MIVRLVNTGLIDVKMRLKETSQGSDEEDED
jgi:hypothetical protein